MADEISIIDTVDDLALLFSDNADSILKEDASFVESYTLASDVKSIISITSSQVNEQHTLSDSILSLFKLNININEQFPINDLINVDGYLFKDRPFIHPLNYAHSARN
jgi:dynactin complex subunit